MVWYIDHNSNKQGDPANLYINAFTENGSLTFSCHCTYFTIVFITFALFCHIYETLGWWFWKAQQLHSGSDAETLLLPRAQGSSDDILRSLFFYVFTCKAVAEIELLHAPVWKVTHMQKEIEGSLLQGQNFFSGHWVISAKPKQGTVMSACRDVELQAAWFRWTEI